MKRMMSTNYSAGAFNFSILSLRLALGILMILQHGYPKLMHFSKYQYNFFDPFHIGSRWSLVLVIFAEVFCSLFVLFGFLTRIAVIPLLINISVALFMYHRGQALEHTELAWHFITGYLVLLFVGPGKVSLDAMTGK